MKPKTEVKITFKTDNTSGFTALHISWHLEKQKIVKDMRMIIQNSKQKDLPVNSFKVEKEKDSKS